MAVFNREINNCSKIDWSILINGSISLYHDEHILQLDIEWLKNNQYESIVLDFDLIKCNEVFHKNIKSLCRFPEYYGENMSALSDCLQYDLKIPDEGGIAFVFKKFNLFYESNQNIALDILERFGEASRKRMLTGDRLIVLLQSDDPLFVPDVIGSHKIPWNRHEFVEKKRLKQ